MNEFWMSRREFVNSWDLRWMICGRVFGNASISKHIVLKLILILRLSFKLTLKLWPINLMHTIVKFNLKKVVLMIFKKKKNLASEFESFKTSLTPGE